ncbi:MAG: pantoate--beta-alanine ligase [Thermaerobacter sp.]|nr:pantoate--beta-alanine ligase [Thermaerobacter sp.]
MVAKLFNLTRPDVAVFGQKDAQQLAVIRRLVKDLNFPVRIVGIPTVREASGLALSSRNRYLSPAEKARAAAIYRALTAARALAQGQPAMPVPPLVDLVQTVLSEQAIDPEYVAVVDPGDFTPLAMVRRDQPALLAVAARVGSARLIDNIALNP